MRELRIAASADRLETVVAFTERYLTELGVPPRLRNQAAVCAEEIFVNIAAYAYPDGAGDVVLRLEATDGGFTMTFTDTGIPFDPLEKEDPDVTLSAEERDVGGLGIFMVKRMMDRVDYRRENGRNRLTLEKRYPEGQGR